MMNISTRGRYATRIMVLLASRSGQIPVNKFLIAEVEGISAAYVQQLLMALRMNGLVLSHRGRGGGFSLARPPATITVSDVLRAVEGEVMLAPCRAPSDCDRVSTCVTRPLWQRAADLLDELFTDTTIADLLQNEPAERQGATTPPLLVTGRPL